MGSVQKRSDRGGRYRARWINPDTGMEQTRMFDRKADAVRHVTAVEASKLAGAYVADHKITLSQYATQWAGARPHRVTTASRTQYLISKHVEGTSIGARRLSELKPSMVQAWATERSRVLAPSTLRLVVGVLRSVLNAAVADRLIASSPATRLSLPRAERDRVIPLTVDEVQRLADAIAPQCRAMVIAQAGLGLRLGELLALRVQDVDFLRRTVRIEEQLSVDGTERLPVKTPSSRRTVPLPSVVADALAAHITQFSSGKDQHSRRYVDHEADGLIFTTPHGLPWRRDTFCTRMFAHAVRDAGLPAGTSSHALRHHYASVLLAAGESVVAVAERLGHENAQLVLTTYGHLMSDSEDRTRRAVDGAWTTDGPGTAQALQS